MVVVTEVFANLARAAARARGMADVRMLVLPHPMETRTREEIQRIALDRMDDLYRSLTLAA